MRWRGAGPGDRAVPRDLARARAAGNGHSGRRRYRELHPARARGREVSCRSGDRRDGPLPKRRQLADGSWRPVAHRPPIESTDIRSPHCRCGGCSSTHRRRCGPHTRPPSGGGRWLAAQTPNNTEERASQLLGMKWAGQDAERVGRATRALWRTSVRTAAGLSCPRRATPTPRGRRWWRCTRPAACRPTTRHTSGGRVPVAHATRGRLVARGLAGDPDSAAVRKRIPPRRRLVDSAAGSNWAMPALTLAAQGQGRYRRTRFREGDNRFAGGCHGRTGAGRCRTRALGRPAHSARRAPGGDRRLLRHRVHERRPGERGERAFRLITEGKDVLDALIAGVNIPELDPLETGIGYGALPNADGVVQLDASCMHGPKKRAGRWRASRACARRRWWRRR